MSIVKVQPTLTTGALQISVSHATQVLDMSPQYAASSLAVARATHVEPVAVAGKWAFLIVGVLAVAVVAVLALGCSLGWDWRVLIAGVCALAAIAVPITVALPKLLSQMLKGQ